MSKIKITDKDKLTIEIVVLICLVVKLVLTWLLWYGNAEIIISKDNRFEIWRGVEPLSESFEAHKHFNCTW